MTWAAIGDAEVAMTGDARRELFDRRRLHDVERLACRNLAGVVDQADGRRGVRAGQDMSERAAELAGSEDGDVAHRSAYCTDVAPFGVRATRDRSAFVTNDERPNDERPNDRV